MHNRIWKITYYIISFTKRTHKKKVKPTTLVETEQIPKLQT